MPVARIDQGFVQPDAIRLHEPSRSREAVEFATLKWLDWFKNRKLLESISRRPPAEVEAEHHQSESTIAA